MVSGLNLDSFNARKKNEFTTIYEGKSGGISLGGKSLPYANAKDYRAAEFLSGNVNASAMGLAKLGAFMS